MMFKALANALIPQPLLSVLRGGFRLRPELSRRVRANARNTIQAICVYTVVQFGEGWERAESGGDKQDSV